MPVSRAVLLVGHSHELLFEMALGLADGFTQEGVEVRIVNAEECDTTVRCRIEGLCPDFVFEFNRTRNQSPNLIPQEIKHIAWIQDAWWQGGMGQDKVYPRQLHYTDPQFGGSTLIYTLLDPQYFGFSHHLQQGVWGILHPGVESTYFYPQAGIVRPDSATICGYIPTPLTDVSEEAKQFILAWHQDKTVTYGYLVDYLFNTAKISVGKHGYRDIHALMTAEINRYLGCHLAEDTFSQSLDKTGMMLLLDTEIPRIRERLQLADAALQAGLNLSIYGTHTWQRWPKYKPYYRGCLRWRRYLAQAFRQTQFNLHNGAFGMHARVLSCMASGGSIFVCTGCFDQKGFDIERHFVAYEHYIPFTLDHAAQTFASWRGRSKELVDIGMNAAEQTLKHHSWRHRAREILDDLAVVTEDKRHQVLA